eukprot:2704344-Rhodomonas_salina.1
MRGTERSYGGRQRRSCKTTWLVASLVGPRRIVPRVPYAMSGTDLGARAANPRGVRCYAMRGTELAYGAMRCETSDLPPPMLPRYLAYLPPIPSLPTSSYASKVPSIPTYLAYLHPPVLPRYLAYLPPAPSLPTSSCASKVQATYLPYLADLPPPMLPRFPAYLPVMPLSLSIFHLSSLPSLPILGPSSYASRVPTLPPPAPALCLRNSSRSPPI